MDPSARAERCDDCLPALAACAPADCRGPEAKKEEERFAIFSQPLGFPRVISRYYQLKE